MKYCLHVDKYKYEELQNSEVIVTNLIFTLAFFKA